MKCQSMSPTNESFREFNLLTLNCFISVRSNWFLFSCRFTGLVVDQAKGENGAFVPVMFISSGVT